MPPTPHADAAPSLGVPLVAVLDVGGTTTTAGLVDDDFGLLDYRLEVPSPSNADLGTIITTFTGLVEAAMTEAARLGRTVNLVSVCIPGPFDYESGRSLMQHKFAALHGESLRPPMEEVGGCPVAFVNDADAFGVGAWLDADAPSGRFGALTLGTGIGSCFLIDGRPQHRHPDVPPDGEVWSLPYDEGVVEDAVSASSVVDAYEEKSHDRVDVATIADRARNGDTAAAEALAQYGFHLGATTATGFARFGPSSITIGGNIVRAWDLIGPRAEAELHDRLASKPRLHPSPAGGEALKGGAHEARRQQRSGLLGTT